MRVDWVTVAMQGDFGKPRPALIVQSDLATDLPTVTFLPLTGELDEQLASLQFRVIVQPDGTNRLKQPSAVMVDKAQTSRLEKIGQVFGRLDGKALAEVDRQLAVFLGLAK